MESISVVVPIFNEEDAIFSLHEAFTYYFENSKYKVVVLLVNDGSTDNSLEKIKGLCAKDEHFRFISFDRNYGLSAAIKAGFGHSKTDLVGYIDADLQTNPTDFLKFEPFLDSFDLVMGSRTERKDKFVKRISSRFANSFRDSLLHDGVQDSGCPLKIIRREMAVKLPFFKGSHRFIPALVLMKGGTIKEIPVSHFQRLTGVSKFNVWNRLIGPLVDTIAVRWMIKREIKFKILSESSVTKSPVTQ
jgi:glycosyltransferase involved in cell wall biosynthesis